MTKEFKKYNQLLSKQSKWESKNIKNGDFTKLSEEDLEEWLKMEKEIDKEEKTLIKKFE